MKMRKTSFLIYAALCGAAPSFGATPGPKVDYAPTVVWTTPDVNATDANGLATRGMLYHAMANPAGTVDRLCRAIRTGCENSSLSQARLADLDQVLAVAELRVGTDDAVRAVSQWLDDNLSSPHRADMTLLLADLTLEQGEYADALGRYKAIDIDALSPTLRDDYLYHKAYAYLMTGDYGAAATVFDHPELLGSKTYGNAARFYKGYLCYVNRDYRDALAWWDKVNSYTLPGKMADYYRAQIAYYDGRYNEALRLATPLLSQTGVPALFTAEANRVVGESLYATGESTRAIPYLKKYVSQVESPERSALYILGLAYYNEGEYKSAVDALTPVTTDKSAMGQSAYLYIGQALHRLGDNTGAIMSFNRALEMDVDPAVTEAAYYNYAVARSRGGGVPFASAVNTFEDFLTRFPDSRHADEVAGYIVTGYVTDGNYRAALNSINKINNPSPRILTAKQNVLYLLGAKQLASDDARGAVTSLSEAVRLARYDKDIADESTLLLGEALYRTGRYDEAATNLLDYLDAVPASAPNRPIALYDLGYTRMAQQDWSKAALNFERLLANPGDLSQSTLVDVYNRLGDARYYQRDWTGAAQAYDKAYSLNPDEGDYPLYQKAVMLGYSGRYADKLASLQLLTSSFPSSALIPDALMQQAEAYTQLHDYGKALDVYRRLIDNHGGTPQGRKAYLFLASSEAGGGDIDAAIDTYQRLIALAPTSNEARLADEAVKRLHAQRGTLAEYAAFVRSIDGAPTLDTEETETLAWNAAEHAYLGGKGTALLEKFVNDYPASAYAPDAVFYLLESADAQGDDSQAYRWATVFVNNYPDNASAEDALIIKAEIEYDRGQGMDALATWETLEQKASSAETANIARLGIMRVARDINDPARMSRTARALLASSTIGADEKAEATFSLALAYSLDNQTDRAVETWSQLAKNPDEPYGAQAAVYAAETLNAEKRFDASARIAEAFVNSGTPHAYWLARGFLALSDAYVGLGRHFEAKEFLKALKENYPGNEPDIFDMIEQRL